MRATSRIKVAFAHAGLVLFCFLTLYPVLWVVRMAFTPSQAFSLSASPVPDTVSLENFSDLVTDRDMQGHLLFVHQMANSLIISAATTVMGIALSATAAYAFSRFAFPGRRSGMSLLLMTQMFPGVVMTIPLYIILDVMGLLDSLSGMALVYSSTSVPFCVWMLKGYFDTIPRALEEAAVMDGMGRVQIFWRIVLPLARPGLVVAALFSFMSAWNEFILAATFLSRPTMYTLPVALQHHVGDFSTEWGRFAAGAVIVTVPVMVLFYALQRHLVGGLTAGGVKG